MKKTVLVTSLGALALASSLAHAMPNPASVFCEEQGGSSKIVEGKDGQYGVCVFSDGTQVDEWEYFRQHNNDEATSSENMPSMANPASVYCEEQGGTLEMSGDQNICVTAGGERIEEWAYYRQSQQADMPSMANPASVYCEEQGGTLEMSGDQNICVTVGGERVEEWEYYRQSQQADMPSMANPASVFCEEQGGTVKITDTAEGQVGICVLANGTEVEEWEFYRTHNK